VAIDLILRGGEVIDPAARRRFHADVAIRDGQIAEVGERLVAESATEIEAIAL
jgi:N-acyl-D-aspartate/D-glutamate deacylase